MPAISAMNDLLARRPKDKHVLYLAGEWLFFQGDYHACHADLVKVARTRPELPSGTEYDGLHLMWNPAIPNPKKAVDYLKHYAAVLPNEANPQDSLGEVLRMAGRRFWLAGSLR